MPDNDTAIDTDRRDVDLLGRLRAVALTIDPVPAEVILAARSAIAYRRLDERLAELTYDSVLDDDAVLAVRGARATRLVTFRADDLTVEVQVAEHGSERRLVGQLVPPTAAEVEIRHAGGHAQTTADALGRFIVDAVGAGLVSIRCRPVGAGAPAPVQTDWIAI